jgi:dolichyl-phosphate-mannose-protein mannosyltransferase
MSRTESARPAAIFAWILAPSRPLIDGLLALARALPLLAATLTAGIWTYVRMRTTWTADGDPALHLKLIKDIAETHRLPQQLPHFPARVAEGGGVELAFPYAYTPLYHALGAVFYAIAGVDGVISMNAIAAAVVAFVLFRLVRRRAPSYVAMCVSVAALASPRVQGPFTGIFMEPVVLLFVFVGAWFAYAATASRRVPYGLAAGVFLGLAIATRQSALVYAGVLGLVVLAAMLEQGRLRPARFRRELPWLGAALLGAAVTAGPALLFLMHVNGGVGYADVTIPFTGQPTPIDPVANEYVSSISKPQASFLEWAHRYRRLLFFNEEWLPWWSSIAVVAMVASGCGYLYRLGGSAKFLARWTVLELLIELAMFVTLHGNSRYLILSQILFFSTAPVGCYAVARAFLRWNAARRLTGKAAPLIVVAGSLAFLFMMFPPGYWHAYRHSYDRDLRSFRASAYADMGAWVNANTDDDALFLTPRTYTAELTWDRDVTWVTFYGNAWVVDAIYESDPARGYEILTRYGVDYVLIADPPGGYVDRMPGTGMRSYLQFGAPPTPHFELVHVTIDGSGAFRARGRPVEQGLRLYRVVQVESATR